MLTHDVIETRPRAKKIGSVLHRYWTLCKVSFQERMEYRFNVLLYMVITLIPALVTIYLWHTIFGDGKDPQAARNITTYYLVAAFISWRIADFQWELMFEVREGRMANDLLRPMSYPAKTFWYEVGGRSWSTILSLPFFVVIAIALGDNFRAPANVGDWLLAILAFMVAFVLSFFITFCLGLVTIWQNQPEGFFALYWMGSRWLGGVFVPLAILPFGLGEWLQWLPFAYIYGLPVRIFMGLSAELIWQGFAVQLLWLALSVLFFKWLWPRAIRRYEVFEG